MASAKIFAMEQQQKSCKDRSHLTRQNSSSISFLMFGRCSENTVKVTRRKCGFQALRKFNFLAEVHSQFIKQGSPVDDLQLTLYVYNRARVLKNIGQPTSKQKPFIHQDQVAPVVPENKEEFRFHFAGLL